MNGNLDGSFEIVKGLALRGQYGQMRENWKRSMYAPSTSFLFDFYQGYAYVDETYRDNRFVRTSLDIDQTWGDVKFVGSHLRFVFCSYYTTILTLRLPTMKIVLTLK